MKDKSFKIQTGGTKYWTFFMIYLILSIGVFKHYLIYQYTGSLVVAFASFLFVIYLTVITSIQQSKNDLIVTKGVLFNMIVFSKKKFHLEKITAVSFRYEVNRALRSRLTILYLNEPNEFFSHFNKKDLKKFIDWIANINPNIKLIK